MERGVHHARSAKVDDPALSTGNISPFGRQVEYTAVRMNTVVTDGVRPLPIAPPAQRHRIDRSSFATPPHRSTLFRDATASIDNAFAVAGPDDKGVSTPPFLRMIYR
eukprot:gene12286-8787_t